MFKLAVLFVVAGLAVADDCPAFGEWKDWTNECLWLPINSMRKDILESCGLDVTPPPVSLPTPAGFQLPPKCGHCSFKVRCQKREAKEGCFPFNTEKDTCHDHGDVCEMGKTVDGDCKWFKYIEGLRQCVNRPELPEWKRESYKKTLSMLPEINCHEVDGKCKCCCHPFEPSEDGATCVKHEEPECAPYGDYNGWSECLWYPLASIAKGFTEHCGIPYKKDMEPIPTPAGFQLPEKCGFCSFKVRCRKRESKEGCFAVDVDKMACGKDDCPTCGEVCSLPKVGGTDCNWGAHLRTQIEQRLRGLSDGNVPYWKKRGLKNIMKHLPHGHCIEKDGQCKCCCHPYEPSADGSSCVPKDVCTTAL